MYNYIKHTRKQMNQGLLKDDRVEEFREQSYYVCNWKSYH